MKSVLKNMVTGGVAAIAMAVSSSSVFAQDDTVYTLKFQHAYPPSLAFYQKTGGGFIDLVEDWSDGRIKFEVFDAGALASVGGMLDAVDQGILDVALSWGGFYGGDVPEADVEVGLPLAWQQPWEAYDAYYNRGLGEVIAEAYESRFNVKHFPAIIALQYGISTRDDIDGLDDLKGMKIRAVGLFGKLVEALGASATVVPGAEIYTSLQLGTVDGLVYSVEADAATGLQEFLKTTILNPNMNSGAGHFMFNKDTWDALPEDLQQVISDAVRYGNMAHAADYAAVEALGIGKMEAAGVKMLTLSDEDQAKLEAVAYTLWDEIATRSDLAAQAVEIVREQQRAIGELD